MVTAATERREMAMLDVILMPDGTALAIEKATDEQVIDCAERCFRFQDARRK